MSGAALFRTSDFLSARFLTPRSTSKISIRNFGLIVLRLTVPRQNSESTELHLSFAKTKNAFEMIGMRSACNIVTRTKFRVLRSFGERVCPEKSRHVQ